MIKIKIDPIFISVVILLIIAFKVIPAEWPYGRKREDMDNETTATISLLTIGGIALLLTVAFMFYQALR